MFDMTTNGDIMLLRDTGTRLGKMIYEINATILLYILHIISFSTKTLGIQVIFIHRDHIIDESASSSNNIFSKQIKLFIFIVFSKLYSYCGPKM